MKDFTDKFFESVENDSPLLFGHIFYKLHFKIFKTPKDLFNWINSTNKSNNFAPIKMGRLNEIRKIYKHKFVKNLDSHLFRVVCGKRHITSEAASTSSSDPKRSSSPQDQSPVLTSANTSTQTLIKNDKIYKMYDDTLAKLQLVNEKLRKANLKLKNQEKIIKKKIG